MEGVRELRFHDSPHGFRCLLTRPGFHGPGGRHFHSDTQERMGRRSRRSLGAKRRRFCQHSGEDYSDRQSPRSASVRSPGERTAPQRRTVFPRGAAPQAGLVVDGEISRLRRFLLLLQHHQVTLAPFSTKAQNCAGDFAQPSGKLSSCPLPSSVVFLTLLNCSANT